MKAGIRDTELLNSIRPIDFTAYLRSAGWWREREEQGQWTKWAKDGGYEILLPINTAYGDYAARIADALGVLEAAENRSRLEIMDDLLSSPSDIMRLRVFNGSTGDGSLPMNEAANLIQRTRDLVLSAACSAIQFRAAHPARKPERAMDFLRHARMGRIERGSFMFAVLCRVPPMLNAPVNGRLIEIEEPFERKAMSTLASGIHAAHRAAVEAAATGKFEAFMDSVSSGVSAGLCAALAGMGMHGESGRDIVFSFHWSPTRPNPGAPPQVAFQRELFQYLDEADRVFRETSPEEGYELCGFVVKLERGEGERAGRVTVMDFSEGHPRKVMLVLEGTHYNTAIEAHQQRLPFTCEGVLRREGRSYVLDNPR